LLKSGTTTKAVSGLEDVGDNYTKNRFVGTGVKGSGLFWAGLPREPAPHLLWTVAPPGLPSPPSLLPCFECILQHQRYDETLCFATCLESAILNGANFHISSGANY